MILKESESVFDEGHNFNDITLNNLMNKIKEEWGKTYAVSHFMSLNKHATEFNEFVVNMQLCVF